MKSTHSVQVKITSSIPENNQCLFYIYIYTKGTGKIYTMIWEAQIYRHNAVQGTHQK